MIQILQGSHNVTKESLIALEKHILETLEFDLQWAGPIPFIERYAKLFSVQGSF